jgi:membrane protein required for colicin V production
MNIARIDVVFIVILFALVANGTSKGFISLFFGKAAFLVGFVTGIIFNNFVSQILLQWIPIVLVTNVLAFLLLFIATYIIIKVVEKILGWIFKGEILKSLDRSLGFLFGLVEGVLVVALILLILNVQPWVDVEGLLQESIFNKIFIGSLSQSVESVSQGIESNV